MRIFTSFAYKFLEAGTFSLHYGVSGSSDGNFVEEEIDIHEGLVLKHKLYSPQQLVTVFVAGWEAASFRLNELLVHTIMLDGQGFGS
ncbi:hypothetical protein Nepgr_019040 [Nepenthes gracilis]|uniref:Uncharacterized protein n=1 Tax=Nepenthes gracilis TaxID=150966 RepID=A0AAD3SUQ1_NEPGR|nr:hypothetical protein Nepgr_019040 [Nepenthes gracilis]